jgi:hypothetical protein
MTSQILIAMDDLETAVRLNAAFVAVQFSTAMLSSLDNSRPLSHTKHPDTFFPALLGF